MLRCTPFLLFDGNCAKAMSFYHDCLGGNLALTRLGDTPMRAQFPVEKHGRIINGFRTFHRVDSSRAEPMTKRLDDRREVAAFLWYPAALTKQSQCCCRAALLKSLTV